MKNPVATRFDGHNLEGDPNFAVYWAVTSPDDVAAASAQLDRQRDAQLYGIQSVVFAKTIVPTYTSRALLRDNKTSHSKTLSSR